LYSSYNFSALFEFERACTFLTGLITGMMQIYKMLLPLRGGGV
jgi:hypothetical protein